MEFLNEITIVKVAEVTSNKTGKKYELVTILTEWGTASLVNRGKHIDMKLQVMTVIATLKVNIGKFTSVEILKVEE